MNPQQWRLALVFCLALASMFTASMARAYDTSPYPFHTSMSAGNRVSIAATHATSAWSVDPNGVNGVKVGRNFTAPAPGGRNAAARAAVALTNRSALMWAARGLAMGSGYLAAGMLLYDLYDNLRVRADGQGGLVWDPGVDPTQQMALQFASDPGASMWAPEASSVEQEWRSYSMSQCANGGYSNCQVQCGVTIAPVPGGAAGEVTCSGRSGVFQGVAYNFPNTKYPIYSRQGLAPAACPTVGGQAVPIGIDGKCPSGQFGEPITWEQAADRAVEFNTPAPEDLAEIVSQALDQGPMEIPAGGLEIEEVTSPVVGPSTTTTSSDGSTVQEAVKWDWSRDPLRKDEGTWNEKKTTTTTDPQGNTTTTETTTEGETAEDQDEACAQNPDRVGCAELGEPPTDQPEWQTVNVEYSPDDLGFGSGCPGQQSWVVFGMTLTWGYQPICDVAPFIRFALIAFAVLGAMGIVVREASA